MYLLRQSVIFVVYCSVFGLVIHFAGEGFPRRYVRYEKFPFRTYAWEQNGELYDRVLHIKKWKKYLPDKSDVIRSVYGKDLGYVLTDAHIHRLIQESCVAEFCHGVMILGSPVLLICMDGWMAGTCTVLYALGNLPFLILQRYNRPRLCKLYAHYQKRYAAQAVYSRELPSEKDLAEELHSV